MIISNQLKNQHLLWRAAFGPMTENANELNNTSPQNVYTFLLKTSSKAPDSFNVASNLFDGLVKGIQDVVQLENLSKEQKQMIRKQSRDDLKNLNLKWLNEMINSEAQLRGIISAGLRIYKHEVKEKIKRPNEYIRIKCKLVLILYEYNFFLPFS